MRDGKGRRFHFQIPVFQDIYINDTVVEDSGAPVVKLGGILAAHQTLDALECAQKALRPPPRPVSCHAIQEIRTVKTDGFGVNYGREGFILVKETQVQQQKGSSDVPLPVSLIGTK